jgi:hypothetical protein
VVEGSGFENRRTRKGTQGSNPCSSASGVPRLRMSTKTGAPSSGGSVTKLVTKSGHLGGAQSAPVHAALRGLGSFFAATLGPDARAGHRLERQSVPGAHPMTAPTTSCKEALHARQQ